MSEPGTRLTLRTLSGYSTVQLGLNAVGTTCLVHLLFFYTDVMHLDAAKAGTVIFIGHLWDGITDPLMGLLSDRTRWRGQRRRPYFIPGALLMALFYAMLFMPPASLRVTAALEDGGAPNDLALFWYMLVAYLAFCTGRTILDVPFHALMPELTRNYDERSRLAGWRTGFMVAGDMMGGLLPIGMLMALQAQRPAFTAACGIIAAVAVLSGIYGTWATFENPPREVRDGAAVPGRGPGFFTALKAMIAGGINALWSRPAVILICTFALVVIGTGFPYTVFRYVSKYFFHDPGMDLRIMICYQVGGLAAAPFWISACRRFNKSHMYQAAIFGYSFCTLPVLFCGVDDRMLFLTAMAGCGFCGTGIWMVPTAIAPDVIEWHRLTKGHANEGAFYGMWSFTSKFAGGVSPWIVGLTLNYVGWVPDVVQDGRVLQAILAMFVIYPLVFLGLGVLLFTWYPITRAVYDDTLHRLTEREGQSEV